MRRIYLWFIVFFVFSAAFTAGVITASGEEGDGGSNPDPWFAVRQSNATVLKPAISAVITYGDLDRGCRCFPLTDDVFPGASCIESAQGDALTASANNCGEPTPLACRRAGNSTVAANYCTDHNGQRLNNSGDPADATQAATIRFPGDNHIDPGEFWGLLDWVEDVISDMFTNHYQLMFPTLQTLLCGRNMCMHSSMGGMTCDISLTMADGLDGNSSCYGAPGDQIMLYANRAFAKIFPYDDSGTTKLRVVMGLWLVNQDYTSGSQYIKWPPDTGTIPVSFPTANTTGVYTGPSGQTGSSELCLETLLRGALSGNCRIYTDALIIRIDLLPSVSQNPITGDYSIFDVCATDAQMDFKSASLQGNAAGMALNCDVENGEDGAFQLMDLETMGTLHSMLRDMFNSALHGTCPGMANQCPYQYYPTSYGTGGGCPGQVQACRRVPLFAADCNAAGNSCAILGGRFCNIDAYYQKQERSTGIPPVDRWINNNQGKYAGEGACTYGIFPMDLNNILNKYQPFNVNMPGYDPSDPKYGTMELGGNTFDLGVFLENTFPLEPNATPGQANRMRFDADLAIRPRWGEYWGCIDTYEMSLPQYTKPPKLPASGTGQFMEPGSGTGTPPNTSNSYMYGAAISQDFFTELMNILYAANLFCWDINKDNILSLLNFASSSTGAGGGFSLDALGELLSVPSFALVAPAVELVADGDGYASVKLVPAGSASARTGVGTYQYPVEYLEDIMPSASPEPGGLKGECYSDSGAGPGKFESFVGVLGSYPNAVTVWYNWKRLGPTCNPSSPTTAVFSILWTGYVMAPYADTYTFCTRTNDGVRLFVNNQDVVNYWQRQATPGYGVQCGSIALSQGLHPIRMEYYYFYDATGNTEAHLYWCVPTSNPYGIGICNVANESYVIPQAYLYSSGTAAGQRTGTYDVYIKLPSSRFEIWAPLDDKIPGRVMNEPVRLFSLETRIDVGLDIEFIRNIVKTIRYWGWDSGSSGSMKMGSFYDFFRIFAEVHPQLVDIKYAADQRLTRTEMEDAVSGIFTSIASAYIQMTIDTKLDVAAMMGMLMPGAAGQDVGLLFRSFAPGGPAGPAVRASQPPLWAADTAPDYLTTYLWVGKDTKINWDALAALLPSMMGSIAFSPPSPVTMGPFQPVLQYLASGEGTKVETESPVQTYIHAPSGVFFEDEPDPIMTRGYALTPAQSLAAGFGLKGARLGFVGYDLRGTEVQELRYSTRFDGGLWGIPRYTQKLEMPPLLEGKHTFEVMAIAPDGMADAEPARLDFTVDTQAPRLKLQNISEETFVTDGNPTFVVEASDFQSQPENIRIAYRLDGGEIVDNGFSKVINLKDIQPPDHHLQILAQDEAGNVGGIVTKFMVHPGRGGFGCGTLSSGGVNQIGTILVVILLVSFPIMLILFLKVYYREKAEAQGKSEK